MGKMVVIMRFRALLGCKGIKGRAVLPLSYILCCPDEGYLHLPALAGALLIMLLLLLLLITFHDMP
jgi:hypothetical protein